MAWCQGIYTAITRKKSVVLNQRNSDLSRCLSTTDLCFVGIGCMLGSGVYILTGEVAVIAGPAAIVSFAISGFAAFFAALCYIECATRFPETGASYLYAYISMGELIGFIVGWNAIIVRVFGVAFVTRGWSVYFDSIIGGRVSNFTIEIILNGETWEAPLLSRYPDIVAGLISLIACTLVAIGTEISAKANFVCVLINVITMCMMIIVAFVYADFSNVTGNSGFSPNGFEGIMKGAATGFSGYVGFEAIAFGAEEAKNPKKSMPIAIILAFAVSIFCYMGGVFAITILADWQDINPQSPFVSAFEAVGATWMEYVVAIGALCSMTGGIINGSFCFARAIYVMGRDGFLPAIFAKTNSSSQTPAFATMFGAALSILVTVFMDFVSVIEFLSFTCFVEFIIVAMACVILRYSPPQRCQSGYERIDATGNRERIDESLSSRERSANDHGVKVIIHSQPCPADNNEQSPLLAPHFQSHQYTRSGDTSSNINDEGISRNRHESSSSTPSLKVTNNDGLSCSINNDERAPLLAHHIKSMKQNGTTSGQINNQKTETSLENMNVMKKWANDNSTKAVLGSLTTAIFNAFVIVFLLTYKTEDIKSGSAFLIAVLLVCSVFAVTACVPLGIMKQYPDDIPFKVPLMPLIPLASILFNLILMARFEPLTWLELFIWTTIGIIFYFSYGIRHSKERSD